MAFIGSVEDRLAIRELYSASADGSCRGDREDWLACWADNGHWITHVFECVGKDAIRQQWDVLWNNFSSVFFIGDVGALEVCGDRATARSSAREIVRLKSGGIYRLAGLYEDELVREESGWLFVRRNYIPLVEELPDQPA